MMVQRRMLDLLWKLAVALLAVWWAIRTPEQKHAVIDGALSLIVGLGAVALFFIMGLGRL